MGVVDAILSELDCDVDGLERDSDAVVEVPDR